MLRRLAARVARPAKRLALGEHLVRRNPLFYRDAAQTFARLSAAPLAARREWTRRRLAAVTRAPRLEAGPLLEPPAVRAAPSAFVRRTAFSVPAATGGTTGTPLPLWRSLRSVAAEQAALDHVLRAAGVDPRRARVAVLRGDDIKPPDDREPPFWVDAMAGTRRIFSSNHLDRATAAAYAAALEDFGADYWWVYPTTLEALCRFLDEAGVVPRTRVIFSSSEQLALPVRERAARRFGARVVDYYGQAERVAFAFSLETGAWRFLPGYAHVELLPAEPDEEGPRYEVVGTGLWNEAMPLPRYRTGDLIRGEPGWDDAALEEVALGVRTFRGVLGRDREFLIAPDGRWLTGMDHIHRGVDHVVRIQLAHEAPERLVIRVLPDRGYGATQRAALYDHARAKLPSAISVEVREVEALERTALGKTPFIVRGPGVPSPRSATAPPVSGAASA